MQTSGLSHIAYLCPYTSLKPLHNIQELPAFVCCELCDIKPWFPLPSVCVFSPSLSLKKKRKKKGLMPDKTK